MHLDHVDPLGQRGPDELENLVAACIRCNLEKSDKEFPELIAAFDGILPGAIVARQIDDARRYGQGPKLVFHEPWNERREQMRLRKERGIDLQLRKPFDFNFYNHPEIQKWAQAAEKAPADSLLWSQREWLMLCERWEQFQRPYYNVYPVIEEALGRTSLEVTAKQACGESRVVITVCFAKGHEPKILDEHLQQFLVAGLGQQDYDTFHILARTDGSNGPMVSYYHSSLNDRLDQQETKYTKTQQIRRLAVGVLLLARDDRFAEPILLAKDRSKDLDPEQYEKAVERARKRTGRRGFTIGRDWMASPHVRRKHFRWISKGRTTPKLIPVKGCIVRRSELLQVPTGYKVYDDEHSSNDG